MIPLRLEVGDWAYLAVSQDELDSLLSGGDMLSSLREDGEFDFASLDPRVVELVYGKGRWWEFRDRPGVTRLADEIRRGRLPPFVIWEVERLQVHCGIEYGVNFDVSSTLESEMELEDRFVGNYSYIICYKLRSLEGNLVAALTERSRELVRRYCVQHWKERFNLSKQWSGQVGFEWWKGYGAWFAYGSFKSLNTVCILSMNKELVGEFIRFLDARATSPRLSPVAVFPEYGEIFSVALEWEWMTGSPSPVLAFVRDGNRRFSRMPSFQELKKRGTVPDKKQVVFVLDADLDGGNPALARIRKLIP